MIIAKHTIQKLDKMIEEEYCHTSPEGQHAIQTVQQMKTFIEGLEAQPLEDIIEEDNPSNFELKSLRTEISKSLEHIKKERMNKVLTLKKHVDGLLVKEVHYHINAKKAIQKTVQDILDNLTDEELMTTEVKVVTEYFENNEYNKLTIKGEE